MSKERANKIYDLLVLIGGAIEREREGFLFWHCKSKDGCDEYRFQGKLGFGGKYFSFDNVVNCYSEDLNTERSELIEKLNEELKKIKTL